jgi:hypothetical protein
MDITCPMAAKHAPVTARLETPDEGVFGAHDSWTKIIHAGESRRHGLQHIGKGPTADKRARWVRLILETRARLGFPPSPSSAPDGRAVLTGGGRADARAH